MADTPFDYYPGTDVLRNNFGLTEKAGLNRREANFATARMYELTTGTVAVPGQFDAAHLKGLHQHLLQDVYEWAGRTRAAGAFQGDKPLDGPFTKPERVLSYGPYATIDERLDAIAAQLKQENYLRGLPAEKFTERAAYYFDQYNYVHPFREGNGRTLQVAFVELGREAGYEVNFARLGPQVGGAVNVARNRAIMRPEGQEHPARSLDQLTAVFQKVSAPLPGATASSARHPDQARPLTAGATTPAMQQLEALRVLERTVVPLAGAVRELDGGSWRRGDDLFARVDKLQNEPARLPAHRPTLDKLTAEVAAAPQLQAQHGLQQQVKWFARAVDEVEKLNPLVAQAREAAPAPVRPTLSPAEQAALGKTFGQAARQLAEGLDEHGYPGPAAGLTNAAKAVERQCEPYLGGANLDAVQRALDVAGKIPALANEASELRQAGRAVQQMHTGPPTLGALEAACAAPRAEAMER